MANQPLVRVLHDDEWGRDLLIADTHNVNHAPADCVSTATHTTRDGHPMEVLWAKPHGYYVLVGDWPDPLNSRQ